MAKRSGGRVLLEGVLCIGAAIALSYLRFHTGLKFGGFDGYISLVLIPLVIYAMRTNVGTGIVAGCLYGIIKYFLTWGFRGDITWEMLVFDYTLSYGAVGLAGLFRKSFKLIGLAAFVGCLAKFGVHYLATVTVYKYVPATFMGMQNPPLHVFALFYNGTRMLPITIITVGIFCLLEAMPDILKEQG